MRIIIILLSLSLSLSCFHIFVFSDPNYKPAEVFTPLYKPQAVKPTTNPVTITVNVAWKNESPNTIKSPKATDRSGANLVDTPANLKTCTNPTTTATATPNVTTIITSIY